MCKRARYAPHSISISLGVLTIRYAQFEDGEECREKGFGDKAQVTGTNGS